MRLSRWEGFGMLRWQPQRVHERTRFITKLLGVSVALHGALCLALFFYQATGGKITFDTKRMLGKDVIVKLVPFGQHKPAVSGGSKTSKKTAGLKKTSMVTQTTKEKKTVLQKKGAKQGIKKTTLAQKKSTAVDKKAAKKQANKQQLVKKQETSAPQLAKEAVNVAPEKAVAAEKVLAKKEELPVVAEAPQSTPAVDQATPVLEQVTAQENLGDSQVMYVNQQEFDALETERLLSEAITQAWHPPVGIPAHVMCQALLEVDWQGNLVSYKLTQLSGIMIYDVSVEEGIKALTFPRAVWGKTIELIFKPWAV